MDNLSEDQKIVDLLTKLKNSNGGYPSDMLAARRRTYLRQMTNVGLGIGIGAGLKEALRGGSNGTATTMTGKIIEIALVAAIALEAGTAAYLYREKIAQAVQLYNNSARAQEVTSPSTSHETNSSDSSLIIDAVDTPLATTSPTPTATPSATSSTAIAGDNNQTSDNDGSANTGLNANSTPNPGENQGNQYGLTPKPVRTKDNNGGGGGEENNNDKSGGGGGGGNSSGSGNSNKP